MKQLNVEQMEKISGGMPCWMAAGLYVVGTAAGIATAPATAGGSLILVGSMTASMYRVLKSCNLL